MNFLGEFPFKLGQHGGYIFGQMTMHETFNKTLSTPADLQCVPLFVSSAVEKRFPSLTIVSICAVGVLLDQIQSNLSLTVNKL